MRLQNPWVGYVQRTYKDYKEKILDRIRLSNPEITDLRESNIFVIIISILAGIAEQIGFYTDKNARESFLGTAQKFSSVVKLVKILDYRVRTRTPATVDVYFTFTNSEGIAIPIQEPGIIPAGTSIATSDGLVFVTKHRLEIPIGRSAGKVAAIQREMVTDTLLGQTDGQAKQEIPLPEDYANNTLTLSIGNETWELVNSLATSLPTDRHFIVEVGEDRIARITFGNNENGRIPDANQSVLGTYYITEGALGNEVPVGALNEITSTIILPQPATRVTVRNPTNPVAGSDMEDIDSIRFNAPISTKTVERAVTAEDFNLLAQRADGVGKASIDYDCGPTVGVYISPINGGIASRSLIEDTKNYLETVRLVGVRTNVLAAGETPVFINLVVTPRFRVDSNVLINEIKTAILERFNVNNNQINGRIAISDLSAVVDNLPAVDYVEIIELSTMPYAFPQEHDIQLDWTRKVLVGSVETFRWQLIYTPAGFRLSKNGEYLGNIPINTQYTDPEGIISLRINPGGMYQSSMTWTFVTYPYNKTIRLTDNTVPLVTDGNTEITITNPEP